MSPILIVDDSREDLALAARVFSQCGIRNPVRLLPSSTECVQYFQRMDPLQVDAVPCVVFLDLVMSPVNGIEVLRQLQEIPAAKASVFIMLSGASDYTMVREGYQLGAATFVVKPLSCEEVLQTFKALRAVTLRPDADGYEVICPQRPAATPLSK